MTNPFYIGKVKIPHRLIMAPMCDITHWAFRKSIKYYGAGLVPTQMVSSKALVMGDLKSRKLLQYDESERPILFQLFGNDADTLAEAAKIIQDMGPDIIDLNMGCPAKKIVNDGGGSALLKNPLEAERIFKKMRAALHIPFTIKIRAGWDKNSDESVLISKIAEECGVDAITLHARTRSQGYSGKANWDLVKQLKEMVKIPVIGNGDITEFHQVDEMIKKTGCDAVMVGREPFSRPWFFKSYLDQKEHIPTQSEIRDMIFSQYDAFFEYFGKYGGLRQMRKHLCALTKGIPDSAVFRNTMVRLEDSEKVKEEIDRFFGL